MDRLWAPWRVRYIQEASSAPRNARDCFVCDALSAQSDRENLLAWRGPNAAVFLNKFPYNNGHLLVAPLVHRGRLEEFEGSELLGPLGTLKWLVGVLDRMMKPQGYNIGLNLGKAAGAGLPGHLHWHIVPRWDGDTNFMPVLGETKVIVESLLDFYDKLIIELARSTPSDV